MNGRRLIEALLGVYVAALLLPTLAFTGGVAFTLSSLGSMRAAGRASAGAGGRAATTMQKRPERGTSRKDVEETIMK